MFFIWQKARQIVEKKRKMKKKLPFLLWSLPIEPLFVKLCFSSSSYHYYIVVLLLLSMVFLSLSLLFVMIFLSLIDLLYDCFLFFLYLLLFNTCCDTLRSLSFYLKNQGYFYLYILSNLSVLFVLSWHVYSTSYYPFLYLPVKSFSIFC